MTPIDYLHEVSNEYTDKVLCLAGFVLHNPDFREAPGGKEHHHNFQGGLVQHTAEVVQAARGMSPTNEIRMIVSLAGIWHDYHKTREYAFNDDGTIRNLPYRHLIGHVTGSAMEFYSWAVEYDFEEYLRDRILHCMLSHHGRREWGSPVEPKTIEAHILHSADMQSMQGICAKEFHPISQ